MSRQMLLAAALSAGTLALAACTAVKADTPPASTTVRSQAIGFVVGASPADHSGQQARRCVQAARTVAAYAGQVGAYVVIDRAGSGPGSANVTYDRRVASVRGQNRLISEIQLEQAENAMVRGVRQEQATVVPGPPDVISAVNAMASHLQAVPHSTPTDVVICGNAAQVAALIDLSDPVQLADTKTTLRAVVSRGLLPHCAGWRVYVIGGSLSVSAAPSDLQDEQLREFWREFFARCGGRLMVWDTTLAQFPISGPGVPPAHWVQAGKITIPLPGSLLFEPNRSTLLPGAGNELGELVTKLTRIYPSASARIAGYTAAVGGPEATALALSRARALTVASYLEAHGVRSTRLTIAGYGDLHQIPGGLAVNRRVVITFSLH